MFITVSVIALLYLHFFSVCVLIALTQASATEGSRRERRKGEETVGGLAFDRWTDDDDGYLYLRAFLHFDPWQMIDLATHGQMLPYEREAQVTNDSLVDGMRVGG